MTGGTMEYVDAHCHVDLYESPHEILGLIELHRIHTIAVTNAPFVFGFTQELARSSRYLHAAVGLHPELIEQYGSHLEAVRPLIMQTRFIGEIGLDYVTPNRELRERQRAAFRRILDDCAASGDKVLTIHSRRAAGDVIDMIGKSYPGTIVLHWFSGSLRELRRAIEFGFYFSINEAMFRSTSGSKLIAAMPKDRVLTETDGPFTKTENHPARPDRVITTCSLLGVEWKITPGEAAAIVRGNFRTISGL